MTFILQFISNCARNVIMSKVNELSFTQGNIFPYGESKFDIIQQKLRENSSKKRLICDDERKLPTPFSFGSTTNKDFSPQFQQTRLQERQVNVEVAVEVKFKLEQYPQNASQKSYVDTFVANILRLAKSNSCKGIIGQCEEIKQILKAKNYLADEFFCSLCCKHKFDHQKNKFENTDCEWPILPLIAQRASCEFLSEFINAIDSVFGVEIIKKMMLVKSHDYEDTALSAAVANGNVKSVSFLLELSEKLGLIEDLINCAPKFEPFNTFANKIMGDVSKNVSKFEAMALFYRDKITKKIGSYKDYNYIAEIVHEKYISLQKPSTNKPAKVFGSNKFAILADQEDVE